MRRSFIAVLAGLALVAAAAVSGAAGASSPPRAHTAAEVGPYTGTAQGHNVRHRHTDNENPNDPEVVDNTSTYDGHFSYSFRILGDGTIEGSGQGSYDSVTWHLEGVSDGQSFSCDPSVQFSGFQVQVSGLAIDGVMHLRFELIDAREDNEHQDCGTYEADETHSTYLADSLRTVQAAQPHGDIDVSQASPSIGRLHLVEEDGPPDNYRRVEHDWNFTIQAPQGPINPGAGPSPGSDRRPGGPASAICTIEGTARRDKLTGTDGNDVICAYGGNDRVNALGGDDIVFGGPHKDVITGGGGADWLAGNAGRDFLRAKDGVRDALRGGPARDRSSHDRGLDQRNSIP